MQNLLSPHQVSEFYLDCFAADQVAQFRQLAPAESLDPTKTIVDIGGGCGYFAQLLRAQTRSKVRVIDTDPTSIQVCRNSNIEAVQGDALFPPIAGDEEVVCFNLILHHLVAINESQTRALQKQALSAWLHRAKYVFISEYVYESYFGNVSGRAIYEITKSRVLSNIGSAVSRVIPSLHANTFGVGVRFRAHDEWIRLFEEVGFRVVARAHGKDDDFALPRRLLLIRAIRRDSFLLAAAT